MATSRAPAVRRPGSAWHINDRLNEHSPPNDTMSVRAGSNSSSSECLGRSGLPDIYTNTTRPFIGLTATKEQYHWIHWDLGKSFESMSRATAPALPLMDKPANQRNPRISGTKRVPLPNMFHYVSVIGHAALALFT